MVNFKKEKTKRIKPHKTVKEREKIYDEAIEKLLEVHLISIDDDGKMYSGFPGIQEFINIISEYKKPNILSGFSGVIKVPELERNIEYILPLNKHVQHGVRLVASNNE